MRPLLLAICAVGTLVILCGLILSGGKGDCGDGVRRVELPKCQSHLYRVLILISAVLAAGSLIAAADRPLSLITHSWAAMVLDIAGMSSTQIALYAPMVGPMPVGLVLAALLIFQVLRPNSKYSFTVGLAIVALTSAALAFATVGTDALVAAVGLPPVAAIYCVSLASLFVGMLGFMALLMRTTMLPRRYKYPPLAPSALPALLFTSLALVAILVGMAGFRLVAEVIHPIFSGSALLVFLVVPLTFSLFQLVLFGIRPKERRRRPRERFPPIDVIMAAWNEEELIRQALTSIQVAGAAYGGTVRVLLGDDGSTDRTVEIAAALNRPGAGAYIEVLTGQHVGKARALNRALETATAEIVVCIDADIQIAPTAFGRLPGWFANPDIGCVGAFDLPNFDLPAWYTKGRFLECIASFGFARLAYERFDANNIPGTFLAFRRAEALALGGWVEGMNGEDSDLTFNFGRLGLVSVIDPRIVIYEDVPQTMSDLVSQRTRWSRASIHLSARHMPRSLTEFTPRYAVQMRFIYTKLGALIRAVTYFQGIALIIGAGRSGSMILRGLVLLSVGFSPPYLLLAALMILYGYWRQIPWVVVLLPFGLVRKIGMINGFMSLPPYRRSSDGMISRPMRESGRMVTLR